MGRFWGLVFLGLGLALTAQAQTLNTNQRRYVFKSRAEVILRNTQRTAHPMTFGLSADQVQGISSLTQGQINLGNVSYVDAPADQAQTFSAEPGFSGVIYPDVPPPILNPPAVLMDADPELNQEWWIERLHVKESWFFATGQGVTIADCDAGYHHEERDLNANLLLNYAHAFSGVTDPNVVNTGGYVYHGTAVATIMVGVLDGLGTNGIAFNAQLVPFQNYRYDASDLIDKEEATAKCILQAIATPNVQIIVLENQTANGSSETFVGTRDAVRLALLAGITVVGAGGNSAVPLLEEAKDNTGSIIVGALAKTGLPASFSNYGDRLTVGAFGEKLHTLYGPDGKFGDFGGTSGATPQVAATVALMKEVAPMLIPEQVQNILLKTRVINDTNRRVGGQLDTLAAVVEAQRAVFNLQKWMQQWIFHQRLNAILRQGLN